MKPLKINFLFAQVTSPSLITGGDVRGKIIADFFKKDSNFKVQIITPKISKNYFKNHSKVIIGNNFLEKIINRQTLFTSFLIFIIRTIELTFNLNKIKTDIIYCTGDFFCNTIPSFFLKIIYPQTKFIVCIHHVNDNPFKRKSNSFLANTISYFVQRFSFLLIKLKADTIFVVNQQVKKYLIQKNFHQPIIISGNGLDIKTIQSQINSLNKIKPTNHIAYFGRLSPTKGSLDLPIILSKILKKYPDYHLDMVGIALPEIKKPLIQKFNQFNCQNHYTIHGFIENKLKVFKILLKSKAIIFPSYEEGWGISLFESIMIKRPVVAYNLPIFKEIFNKKLSTAPIGNINIISQKIINFIKNYNQVSTQKYMKHCCSIAQQYDWENVFLKENNSIINLLKK